MTPPIASAFRQAAPGAEPVVRVRTVVGKKSHLALDTSPSHDLKSNRMESRAYSRDYLAGMLRSYRITPTHQRIEIAHALFSRCAHLSADQILAIVNDRNCETSKATVYNTLNVFLREKLIREVIVDPSRVFYDPNTAPHHHFYNVDTGELTDIDEAAIPIHIAGLPPLPRGMTVAGIDVIVRIRSR